MLKAKNLRQVFPFILADNLHTSSAPTASISGQTMEEARGTLVGKELALWMKWEKMVKVTLCDGKFQLLHMKFCSYLF